MILHLLASRKKPSTFYSIELSSKVNFFSGKRRTFTFFRILNSGTPVLTLKPSTRHGISQFFCNLIHKLCNNSKGFSILDKIHERLIEGTSKSRNLSLPSSSTTSVNSRFFIFYFLYFLFYTSSR